MGTRNLYPNSSSIELDLRKEFSELLYGASLEVPKGRTGLLRQMRLDTNGNPIRCSCRDILTDEPDKDYYCRNCLGVGWLWDESKIVYYRNDDSFRKVKGKDKEYEGDDFFVSYNKVISTRDFLIIVTLDTDGEIAIPITRESLFKIISADPFRADNGRIEFWRIRAIEERKWSVWYGQQNRQYNSTT